MKFLYNVAFFLFCLFSLPIFFLKKKSGDHLRERFGSVPQKGSSGKKVFWFHAVSVGEALAAQTLIQEIRERFPPIQFVFSTTTRTGRSVFEKIRKPDELIFYFPLDFRWVLRRTIQKVKPDFFATMETEIWPNLILALKEKNVPIFLLNGRVSPKSFRRYHWVRGRMKPLLRQVDLCCMQSPEDGERIRLLGADPAKVHVTGNMKFDLPFAEDSTAAEGMRKWLGIAPWEKLWIAGSTHPGEEESLLEVYTELSKEYPVLRLLLAPRHPERRREVVKLIEVFHRQPLLISENDGRKEQSAPVFVLDTIGQLRSLYAAADLVFVGGSLVPKGGQNLLEPALLAKPILFGPHMENFQDIVRLFLKGHAALQVQNKKELSAAAQTLLQDETLCRALGERARGIVLRHRGVVNRHLELLNVFLSR